MPLCSVCSFTHRGVRSAFQTFGCKPFRLGPRVRRLPGRRPLCLTTLTSSRKASAQLMHLSTGLGEAETPVLEERKKKVTQSFPTLCDPIDCSLPGSSIHGILQARILEWGAISFSRGREPGRAPPRHAHGDLTSLAPHERLPEILVVHPTLPVRLSQNIWGN